MPNHSATSPRACAGRIRISTRRQDRGAEDGARTRDLNLGKVALYQLSYFRVAAQCSAAQPLTGNRCPPFAGTGPDALDTKVAAGWAQQAGSSRVDFRVLLATRER